MSEPPERPPGEARADPRRRALLSGALVYGAAELTLGCAISDLSRSGARVRLHGAELLMEPIYLVDLSHGLAYRARQAWRRDEVVGLAFVDYFDLRQPPPELPRIVRRLWVDHSRQSLG
jgi:hypothetical protein